jgi:hypothetical protein
MKKILFSIILILLIALSTDRILSEFRIFSNKDSDAPKPLENTTIVKTPNNDPLNMSYTIEDYVFTLSNGVGTATSSVDSLITSSIMIFGTPTYGDLDGDGDSDAVILLVQESGGTGSFYYGTLAIKEGDKYVSTNALFLGDRIAPQTVEIQDGKAVFNIADRKENESMATPPSVGKSIIIDFNQKTNTISTTP